MRKYACSSSVSCWSCRLSMGPATFLHCCVCVYDIVVRYTSIRNGYVKEIAMYSYRLGTNGEPVAVDCRSLTVCPFCSVLYLQTYSNLGRYLIRPACLLPRLSCNFQCSM